MTSLQNLHGMVGTHVTLSLGYMAFLLSSNSTTEKKDNPFFRKSTFGLVMSALVMFQFMFFVPLGFQKVTENITYGYIVSMLLMFLIEGTLVCVLTAVTVLTFIQCRKNHSLKLHDATIKHWYCMAFAPQIVCLCAWWFYTFV